MKYRIATIAAASLLLAGTTLAGTASARDSFSVSIGVPGFAATYGNRGYYDGNYGGYYGGYYSPAPVIYAPPVVYAPRPYYYEYEAPVVYAPAPVVYGPRVVYGRPYYRPYYRPYHHARYWQR